MLPDAIVAINLKFNVRNHFQIKVPQTQSIFHKNIVQSSILTLKRGDGVGRGLECYLIACQMPMNFLFAKKKKLKGIFSSLPVE